MKITWQKLKKNKHNILIFFAYRINAQRRKHTD
mgnify:CR=1 FL=1